METWKILNDNLSLLIIGSLVGWLFLNLVWEPYRDRQRRKDKRKNLKVEVYLRLAEIDNYYKNKWFGFGIGSLIGGETAMTPDFKNWALTTLIFNGWDEKAYYQVFDEISSLKSFNSEPDDEDRMVSHKRDIITKLRAYLNTHERV